MKTTFLVVLRTAAGENALTEHEGLASETSQTLEWIFSDEDKVAALYSCKGDMELVSVECELTIEGSDFVAKCLIDIEASAKVQLSKNKISEYLQERGMFSPAWKLEKRIVSGK